MTDRKHYIDWVRVLAFFLLIFFHCAMPFVIFGWEIKNKEQSAALSQVIWWLHQWRLPLLFFISGVGVHFSLQKRSVVSFGGERIIRLLLPLLFAMFFTIPLQVYYERLQKGQINGSYLDFYPTVWDMVPYPEGTLTWSHMWFVVYLLVFCILLLPVFGLLQIRVFKRAKRWLAEKLSHPVLLPLLFLPLAALYFTLYLPYPEQQSLLDDWFLFLFSLTLLLFGYLLGGAERFWESCERFRFVYLSIAAVCIGALYVGYWRELSFPKEQNMRLYWYGALNSVHIWLLILSLLGFAKRHLNFRNRFLHYTNQAVYPFYILHQTVIVAMGYYIVQWNLLIVLKLLLLVIVCFAAIASIYHFLIRPFIVMRLLYGLKPKRHRYRSRREKSSVQAQATPVASEV
jgi:hypothetical protein